MRDILNIATVFSGIGAPEQALHKLGVKNKIIFACDNGEIEIKNDVNKLKESIANLSSEEANKYIKKVYAASGKHNYMKDSYFANYDIREDNWFEDIRFLDGKPFKGIVDMLVGGSPCQSFSIIGKRAGLEDTRGTLFYDYARLIKEIEPKVFIFENVPGMLTHDKGNTWKVINSVFDSLGYKVYKSLLNAKDFGIPQDRTRLFVVGFKDQNVNFEFPKPVKLNTNLFDYLEDNNLIDVKHYLGKKGFEFVTNPKYRNRARINPQIIQTQKANQQFNWNGDFVFVPYEEISNNEKILARAYDSYWENKHGVVRQLTYRECLRLMGFSDDFKVVVPNVPAYRQAGNSIVVNVLEAIYEKIFEAVNIYED